MSKADYRKTKAELIAELEALRRRAAAVDGAHPSRESEERYRRLVQFFPEAIRITCNGTIVYVNDAAVRLFGADCPERLIGRDPDDFVPAEDREVIAARRRMLLATGIVPPEERSKLRLDGGVVPVEISSMRIDWQGRPAALTVLRDISQRVQGRKALEESEQRLAAIAANIPGATYQCVLYGNGRIAFPYVSRGVRDLFGIEAADIMADGGALLRAIHAEDRKALRRAIRESAKTPAPVEVTLRARPDGKRTVWVRSVARPRRRADGGIVWDGVFLDATERHEAAEALRAAKDAAEFANRSKSEFLANMSHELRTPLNAIMGFSEVIERKMFGPVGSPRYAEYAADIRTSGDHLLRLINDILDLSKVEAGRMELDEETVDVARVIESSVSLLKRRAEAGKIKLAVRIASKLPQIRADERRLRQILLNLLSNASKFTPDGGTVRVSATADAEAGMRIRIADTGIGIPRKDLDKVFTPFGQAGGGLARTSEGTGLGLPLARTLVERHGGKLDLRSRPGKGTTVTIRLPPVRLVA